MDVGTRMPMHCSGGGCGGRDGSASVPERATHAYPYQEGTDAQPSLLVLLQWFCLGEEERTKLFPAIAGICGFTERDVQARVLIAK